MQSIKRSELEEFAKDPEISAQIESDLNAIKLRWEDYQSGNRGSFAKALANAFDLADLTNLRKLADAFPSYYKAYAEFHGDVLHKII